MRKRSIMWAGLVGLLAVIVVGTSVAATGKSGSTSKAGVLRMSIGAEPPSLDAGLATDTTSASILFNIMDSLVRLGPAPALKAEPGAAKSWTVKGATVTLNLDPKVKWSNGAPTTAAGLRLLVAPHDLAGAGRRLRVPVLRDQGRRGVQLVRSDQGELRNRARRPSGSRRSASTSWSSR